MNKICLCVGVATVLACGSSDVDTPISPTRLVLTSPAGSGADMNINVGVRFNLSAQVRESSGALIPAASITWSSSRPAAATVDPNGLVTGIAAGTAYIKGFTTYQGAVVVDSLKVAVTQTI